LLQHWARALRVSEREDILKLLKKCPSSEFLTASSVD
jgi:hypothetical protein